MKLFGCLKIKWQGCLIKQNISLHINNCFKEKELEKTSTVKEYLTVQKKGNRNVRRIIELYNLDVIISIGYRVKSKEGTQFRIWANRVLKGYAMNQRMNRIENTVENLAKKVNEFDFQINSKLIPTKGVFFQGQVFDAYELTSRIIRSAKKNIVLIDNYIDESTLTHLSKKADTVAVTLFTKRIYKQLSLDIQKATQKVFETYPANTNSRNHILLRNLKDINSNFINVKKGALRIW